jgi:hypothetical protein
MTVDERPKAKPGEEGTTAVAVRVESASQELVEPPGSGANRAFQVTLLPRSAGGVEKGRVEEGVRGVRGVPGVGEPLLGVPGCFGPLGAVVVVPPVVVPPVVVAPVVVPTVVVPPVVWTPTLVAGAAGPPDETLAPIVPPGVAVDAPALTPLDPAETFAVVCVGPALTLAPADGPPPDVGTEAVAFVEVDEL